MALSKVSHPPPPAFHATCRPRSVYSFRRLCLVDHASVFLLVNSTNLIDSKSFTICRKYDYPCVFDIGGRDKEWSAYACVRSEGRSRFIQVLRARVAALPRTSRSLSAVWQANWVPTVTPGGPVMREGVRRSRPASCWPPRPRRRLSCAPRTGVL